MPDESTQVHAITRASASCAACALPIIACLCAAIEPIRTRSRFVLLTSRKETARASNTGRLLKLLNPEMTEIIIWDREQTPEALSRLLRTSDPVWLVYPSERESAVPDSPTPPGTAPVFLLLDGTWQEARKMTRRSAWLAALPRLALAAPASGYALRANQRDGTLCTIEAAAACLTLVQEPAAAHTLLQGFDLFQAHFLAGRSGHVPKAHD